MSLSVQSVLLIVLISPLTPGLGASGKPRRFLPLQEVTISTRKPANEAIETPLTLFSTFQDEPKYSTRGFHSRGPENVNFLDLENVKGNITANLALLGSVTKISATLPFDNIPDDFDPDTYLTPCEMIRRRNYPAEKHFVTTEDGFILEMHRIPNPEKPPVLLQHGFLCSSTSWILTGPENSLAYILWDLGYDVWMGNLRGNKYSRRHAILSSEDPKFWDHSFHEMGLYDLPAEINYILRWTRKSQLDYIGHSMGTTIFFVMTSERPEYNKKIRQMHALAPIGYMSRVRSPLRLLSGIMDGYNAREFFPSTEFFTLFGRKYCRDGAETQWICLQMLFWVNGFDKQQLNTTMLPLVFAHFPAGVSFKTAFHFGQEMRKGSFRKYDFGKLGNLEKYGSIKPPPYDLSKITSPVYMYYGANDWLSHPKNVIRLCKEIPGCRETYRVPYSKFNHLDFAWANDVKMLLYDKLIDNLLNDELSLNNSLNK